MPSKSRPVDTGAVVSEQAIRDRAYFLWEQAGRPDGTGDHYWHLALAEATRTLVELSSTGVANAVKASKGKKPPEPAAKAAKSKPKDAAAAKAKAKAKVAKPAKAEKPAKKAVPKPRAAAPKA